ncbi:MAG TPA: phosphoadenylyl-sulfate reductase [Candidatus Methylacidiphilales bacterium]|nr:phosphoadenylyl-sulfate reductase [Candidatus Methylacidiphilales bacterium]
MEQILELPKTESQKREPALSEIGANLEKITAEERVRWALERFRPDIMLSSSFGAQSAVSLHLVTRQWPEIPVVLVDTGYLFPETYRFVDELTARLKLNLKVYRAAQSAAWQEARHGKLWEHGVEGIETYNRLNKVEPMERALRELGVQGWITGLRRQQAASRNGVGVLQKQNGVIKIQPIIDWTDRMVFDYLKKHDLPYHPLWEQGYVSIGDVHTTRPLSADMTEEETRFFGLKRECGLHIGENI